MINQGRQELFNKAVGGLIEQGECAQDPSNGCMYRLEKDGKVLKCIVGQIISDEMAARNEGIIVSGFDIEDLEAIFGPYYRQEEGFWDDMQSIHDSAIDFATKIQNYKELAAEHELEWIFG